MTVLKCKMCNANLKIVEGQQVCVCDYCGTTQTIQSMASVSREKYSAGNFS